MKLFYTITSRIGPFYVAAPNVALHSQLVTPELRFFLFSSGDSDHARQDRKQSNIQRVSSFTLSIKIASKAQNIKHIRSIARGLHGCFLRGMTNWIVSPFSSCRFEIVRIFDTV